MFCPLSGDRISLSQRFIFYNKVNWGHVVCPSYGGSLSLRESVVRGSMALYIHGG